MMNEEQNYAVWFKSLTLSFLDSHKVHFPGWFEAMPQWLRDSMINMPPWVLTRSPAKTLHGLLKPSSVELSNE